MRSGGAPALHEGAAEGWCCEHRPPVLIADPGEEGGGPMPDHRQLDPDQLRVVLDHGEVVELDGGTLVLDGHRPQPTRRIVVQNEGTLS